MKNNISLQQQASFTRSEIFITLIIVLLSFVIRVIRLDIPHDWSFDEVYHSLSAEAYALNDPRGYEWFNSSPKDLAWEWLHPPFGKLAMGLSIKLLAKPYIPESKSAPLDGRTTFAWRFPGTIFAALTVGLLIIFGKKLFNKFWIGAVAGTLYALDGLSFVQSRTGMNDIYITFFTLLTFYCIYLLLSQNPKHVYRNLLWIGLSAGLAASSKWSGFYAVGIACVLGLGFVLKRRGILLLGWLFVVAGFVFYSLKNFSLSFDLLSKNFIWFSLVAVSVGAIILLISNKNKLLGVWTAVCLVVLPVVVYVSAYGQWWLQKHTIEQFYQLHQQIWWYQTRLKATHGYQSPALSWPILWRPVWFYVKYQDHFDAAGNKTLYIGNIYTMGNPVVWWAGLIAILYGVWQAIFAIWNKIEEYDQKNVHLRQICILLIGYFGMFLPWAVSPRIMFLYHYLPSVPFLCLLLAYGLWKIRERGGIGEIGVRIFLGLVVAVFIFYYPHWSALPLPQDWVKYYYWLPSWK